MKHPETRKSRKAEQVANSPVRPCAIFESFFLIYALISTTWFAFRFLWLLRLAAGLGLLTPAPPAWLIFILLLLLVLKEELIFILIDGSQVHIRDFCLLNDDIGYLCIFYIYIVSQIHLLEFRLSVLFCLDFRLDLRV